MSDSGNPQEVDVNEVTKEDVPEHMQDQNLLTGRSCTDCCMIIVAFIFVIGWIIILAVAAAEGKPERILFPENFRGDLCGDLDPLVEHKNLWIPKPSRLSYGLCVKRCPAVGDIVCNNDVELGHNNTMVPNHIYSMTSAEASRNAQVAARCTFFTCDAADRETTDYYITMQYKKNQFKCFTNWYVSGATLFRCLPFGDDRDNMTLASLAGESADTLQELADYIGVGAFFSRGFAEVEQAWPVILICAFTCCVLSLIWVFLLRWLIGPIVLLCIVLVFALLVLIGYFAKLMADDLENIKLPGDTATENQVILWRTVQWGAWFLALVYIILMLYLSNRIRVAIAVMEEASRAYLETPSMVIVPPIVFILVCGWIVFFIVTTLYIQTIGNLDDETFKDAAVSTFGEDIVNLTLAAVNSSSQFLRDQNVTNENHTINTTRFTTDEKIKILHAYNFFGVLWAANFCIMYGFFIMAMCVCVYYYSATQENMRLAEENDEAVADESKKTKGTPPCSVPLSFLVGLRYHLGTILWGALLIAIIQFIRFIFLYLEEEFLNDWFETCNMGFVLRCIECCLWYIENVIRIISKNAYIVCCVKNESFCESAGTALSLLVDNGARIGILIFLSTVACFVLKLFIVMCNMILAWVLINLPELTQGREMESGLFPMAGILLMSFVIASLFINVYEACIDAIMMCFLIDEKEWDCKHAPESLAKLCDKFTSTEEARQKYNMALRISNGIDPADCREPYNLRMKKKDKEDSEPKN